MTQRTTKLKTAEKNIKGYKPEAQRPACCVPACLRMVFKRHNIIAPNLSQEDIGNQLGLIVPLALRKHFKHVTVCKTTPPSGYGTRINQPEYSLEKAFQKWALPLSITFRLADTLHDKRQLQEIIESLNKDPAVDIVLCVQSGALEGNPDPVNGHVVLLSGADKKGVYYIDPATPQKIDHTSYKNLFDAIRLRGRKNQGGLWIIGAKPQ